MATQYELLVGDDDTLNTDKMVIAVYEHGRGACPMEKLIKIVGKNEKGQYTFALPHEQRQAVIAKLNAAKLGSLKNKVSGALKGFGVKGAAESKAKVYCVPSGVKFTAKKSESGATILTFADDSFANVVSGGAIKQDRIFQANRGRQPSYVAAWQIEDGKWVSEGKAPKDCVVSYATGAHSGPNKSDLMLQAIANLAAQVAAMQSAK